MIRGLVVFLEPYIQDLDNFDIFLKLTEDCRRERQLTPG